MAVINKYQLLSCRSYSWCFETLNIFFSSNLSHKENYKGFCKAVVKSSACSLELARAALLVLSWELYALLINDSWTIFVLEFGNKHIFMDVAELVVD